MKRSIDRVGLKQISYMVIEYLYADRWTKNIALIFLVVLALFIAPSLAQSPMGKDLNKFYQEHCSRCHGPDGSAVSADGERLKGQDFTDQDWQRNTRDDKMVKAIQKGIFFGLAMPSFKDALTEEEARRMVTDIIRESKKGKLIAPDAGKKSSR